MATSDVYMRFFVGDYARDTGHLSAEEHGAYLLLLFHAWTHDGVIPGDSEKLRRITRVDFSSWDSTWATVREFLIQRPDGTWLQPRLMVELDRAKARVESAVIAGRASAAARQVNARSTGVERAFNACANETHLVVGHGRSEDHGKSETHGVKRDVSVKKVNGRSTGVQRALPIRSNGSSTVQGHSQSDPDLTAAPSPSIPALEVSSSGSDPDPDQTAGAMPAAVTLELALRTPANVNGKPAATRSRNSGVSVFERVCDSFSASWERCRQAPYIVTPADKKQLGTLLQTLTPDVVLRLPEIFDRYCGDVERFVSEQGHSLKYFCTSGAINKYASTDRARGLNERERRGVTATQAWLESHGIGVAK